MNPPDKRKNVERFRIRNGCLGSDESEGNNGAFFIPYDLPGERITLSVIVSDAAGWDHVSVSHPDRCPTWAEMCYVKRLFFRYDEWVVQYHPPPAENISAHDFCLHMWRPQRTDIVRPPSWMVGPPAFSKVRKCEATGDE